MFIHDGPGGWAVGSPPPVRGAEQQQARLPFLFARNPALPRTDGLTRLLTPAARVVEGTAPVPAAWDHRAIHSSGPTPYAAGTNLLGKEVPATMLSIVTGYISTFLAKFHKDDEEGQTLVEYGLLLALIAIIVIVALLFLGPIVSRIFQNVGTSLHPRADPVPNGTREPPARAGGSVHPSIAGEGASPSDSRYQSAVVHKSRRTRLDAHPRLLTAVTTGCDSTRPLMSSTSSELQGEYVREAIEPPGHLRWRAARHPGVRRHRHRAQSERGYRRHAPMRRRRPSPSS